MKSMPKPSTGADATRRAARTLFQIGTVTALIQLWNLFSARPLTADQTSAITVVGTLLITFVQNLLEEAGAVPTMLKGKPDIAPPTALVQRELESLAAAIGSQHNDIERLEGMMLDLRNDIGSWRAEPEDPARISARSATPAPWQHGELG